MVIKAQRKGSSREDMTVLPILEEEAQGKGVYMYIYMTLICMRIYIYV
jgi:hypothetical protein